MTQPPPPVPGKHPARLSAQLHRVLAAATAKHQDSVDQLRDAICEYLDSLKAGGLTRADAILAVHAFVADVESREGWRGHSLEADDGVVTATIEWCSTHWDAPKA